jgi:hypothetical protein
MCLFKAVEFSMVFVCAPVAQQDRASDFESAGRPFESGRARHVISRGWLWLDCETREARILEPIFALSDVFMELRRDPNQRIPYGLTMPPTSKSRIMSLPPRLPQATWEAILGYILEKPADWNNLTPDESIPEKLLYPGLDGEQ